MVTGGSFILPSDKPSEIFTVHDRTEDQIMARDSIKAFVQDNIASNDGSKRIESKDWSFNRDLLAALGRLGFLGAEIPEEFGGVNLGTIVSTIAAEEVARQGSFAVTFLAHTGIGTLPIRIFGTQEQKEKYLPKLTNGEMVAAYALTEAQAGSDAKAIKTSAVLDGSHWVLSGEKIFITNSALADLFIVFAKVNGEHLSAFVVERNDGLVVGKEEHKMGILGSSTAAVRLSDVRTPIENILGEPGDGFKIAMTILNFGRFKLAAAALGGSKLCLEESAERSKTRKQFGVPIAQKGLIRQKLADMAAKIFAQEAVVYRTAAILEEVMKEIDGRDTKEKIKALSENSIECSVVKVFGSEMLCSIADENVQIHGGEGFIQELPAERHLRDARINKIFEGTNEVNRGLIAGEFLRRASSGQIMSVIKKLQDDITTPSLSNVASHDNFLEQALDHLNSAKKLTLVGCGIILQKHSPDFYKAAMSKDASVVDPIQELLGLLADCLIDVYVLDSVLGRIHRHCTEQDELLARLVYAQTLTALEARVRKILASCSEGDELRVLLAAMRRIAKFKPENEMFLHQEIAKHLLGAA